MEMTKLEIGVLAALVVVLGLVGVASFQEAKRWDAFKAEHDCKMVSQSAATTSTGVGMGMDGKVGVVSMTTPGKTGWTCDDGVTYWR